MAKQTPLKGVGRRAEVNQGQALFFNLNFQIFVASAQILERNNVVRSKLNGEALYKYRNNQECPYLCFPLLSFVARSGLGVAFLVALDTEAERAGLPGVLALTVPAD